MHIWNLLHVARWKCRTQKWWKKSPSGHHRTTLSGFIFTTKALIDNRKKTSRQQYLPHMSSQYGELWPISGCDLLASLGHPCKFQRVLHLGSVTARQSSSGRQPNFAAVNRGRHLYSAGRPSRWALATFVVSVLFSRWHYCRTINSPNVLLRSRSTAPLTWSTNCGSSLLSASDWATCRMRWARRAILDVLPTMPDGSTFAIACSVRSVSRRIPSSAPDTQFNVSQQPPSIFTEDGA